MKMTEGQVRTMLRNMRTAIEEDETLQEVFMGTNEAIAVINLITTMTAERDALKAQLAAVPVKAISEICTEYDSSWDTDVYLNEVLDWLRKVTK